MPHTQVRAFGLFLSDLLDRLLQPQPQAGQPQAGGDPAAAGGLPACGLRDLAACCCAPDPASRPSFSGVVGALLGCRA